MGLQVLSGGQSRALMIADIAILSDAPIVLIDEVENAGIDKYKALEILCGHNKIAFCATHDPVLILMNKQRLVMANGGMSDLIAADTIERHNAQSLKDMDSVLTSVREALRQGQIITDLSPHQPRSETVSA
jgi:ABC-type lipoprotein export system ATPase subunit